MKDDKYWLIGKITIPPNKKKELNQYVLKLLFKGGIRKTEEIQLDGRTLTVIKKPAIDENGIVHFDYSIFEKIRRETGIYDTNTCELQVTDRGYNEYGLIMNMILVLQEAYSDGNCYVMCDTQPLTYISGYLRLIYSLIGKKFYLEHRARMFDMVLFFKKNSPEVTPTVIAECWNDCLNFSHLNPPQRQAYFDIKNKKVPTCEEKDKINSKTEIANAVHAGRMEYLFKIIHELVSDNDKDFLQYLSMLITLNSKERKELANSGEPCGIVAEASLYMHPASIISLYALVKNMDFWSMWDLLPASKYEDIDFKEHKDDKKPVLPIEYYKFMRRKNQDEFLEFWDGENLLLSDNLLASITDWNKKIAQASDISPESINRFLSDIIFDLNNDWKCRLVDKEFVELILSNRNDATYRKALRVLRDLMDEDTKLFPELTRSQAIDWIICNYRDTHDRIRLSAYQSLLTNKQQRKKTLNF